MLVGIGVEPLEQLGGRCLLENDGCHKAQDIVPVLVYDLPIDALIGKKRVTPLLIDLALLA
jgi:hypothetical protein